MIVVVLGVALGGRKEGAIGRAVEKNSEQARHVTCNRIRCWCPPRPGVRRDESGERRAESGVRRAETVRRSSCSPSSSSFISTRFAPLMSQHGS